MDVLANIDPTASGNALVDPYRPSFFELIAQAQLAELLKPAARYVLTVLAQRNPRYLLRIANRFEEIYALLMLLVDRHYLRTWNASFTENFYGLMRRRCPAISAKRIEASASQRALQEAQRLRPREINASLFMLVGAPYIEAKLTQYWEHLGGGISDANDLFNDEPAFRGVAHEQTLRQKWEGVFRKGYPYAKVFYQLWMLAYNIGYLFNRTPYWRPWYRWLRMDVRRMQGNEQPLVSLTTRPLPPPTKFPLLFLWALSKRGSAFVFEMLKYALPASIFFFKFLEWWYSPSNPRRRSNDDGDAATTKNIAPPEPLLPSEDGVLIIRPETWKDPRILTQPAPSTDPFADAEPPRGLLHNACPLCGVAPIQNAALLASGYAFCYTCAHAYA
ncbi:Pex12p [Malassezia vespertilionis]|uniref:Peroxisome assembly protein 12 n=1 Tax=Malassezia vespertilionis TaxID=2020962 RepID=A0A2N1J854_9BASI|nr:Pex12p [Malassezia vespertilionis]